MSKPAPIRVLVADDHVIVRLGLATLVNRQRDMQVVGQASSGTHAVELFRQHRPDVILMDLRMPGRGGVEAIGAICAEDPRARVIVLTIHKGDEAVYQALRAGARGYLLKDAPGRRSWPPSARCSRASAASRPRSPTGWRSGCAIRT